MDPRNLYTLRYRQGSTGVIVSYITATSQERADILGKWWCNQKPNCRFIKAEPAIVADESEIPKDVLEQVESSSAKRPAVSTTATVTDDSSKPTTERPKPQRGQAPPPS